MRRLLCAGLLGLLGCSGGSKPPAALATVVYTAKDSGATRLFAISESGGTPVPLSPAGQGVAFAAALADRRSIYAATAGDGTLLSLHGVSPDGKSTSALGALPARNWNGVDGAWLAADGSVVVEALRADGGGFDLLVSRRGAASLLAHGRFLALAGDRVAFLKNERSAGSGMGDVGSIRLDGSGELLLGGGGARDRFLSFAAGQLLFTSHAGSAPQVRSVALDGSNARVRVGSDGVLAGGALLVAVRDNALERLDASLAPTPLQLPSTASPLLLLEDGRLVARVAGTGLVLADAQGVRTLDAFDGDSALEAHLAGDDLFYTANTASGTFLRAVHLDGASGRTLSKGVGQALGFIALLGGRALFYRTKGTEAGGWLATVGLDGKGETLVGDDATGTRRAADMDFGAITKAGRLLFEAELHDRDPRQVYVVEPMGEVRALTGDGAYATLSAVLE